MQHCSVHVGWSPVWLAASLFLLLPSLVFIVLWWSPSSVTTTLLSLSIPHILKLLFSSFPGPSPHCSSDSCSKLPLAWSSVCVLDSAFLDGSVCKCRETLRSLASSSVSRCFFGVWQLFASAWLSLLLLTRSALSSVFLHYCTHLKTLLQFAAQVVPQDGNTWTGWLSLWLKVGHVFLPLFAEAGIREFRLKCPGFTEEHTVNSHP